MGCRMEWKLSARSSVRCLHNGRVWVAKLGACFSGRLGNFVVAPKVAVQTCSVLQEGGGQHHERGTAVAESDYFSSDCSEVGCRLSQVCKPGAC